MRACINANGEPRQIRRRRNFVPRWTRPRQIHCLLVGLVCSLLLLGAAEPALTENPATGAKPKPESVPEQDPNLPNGTASSLSNGRALSLSNGPDAPPPSPAAPEDALLSENLLVPQQKAKGTQVKDYRLQIDTARQLRRAEDFAGATRMLVTLLEEQPPPEIKRSALFELALASADQKKYPRAQQILAQYIKLFPEDPTIPEVLLRQGLIFRQMGAHQMALAKFYGVMNSALNLKLDQFDYYKRLVLQAQAEIADTYYLQGKFAEAADYFGRILKQDASELDRGQVQFKLIRCLANLERHAEVVTQCEAFFVKHRQAPEFPELRFICASSLKRLGRSGDALGQVLTLLESQQRSAATNPENWSYWQQRAGNEIANQLYLEGDYLHALEIYTQLVMLDTSVAWQLPVQYQIGLIYERLNQPQKATDAFNAVTAREKEVAGPAGTPTLKTVVEMAKWRRDNLTWQRRAELAVQSLHLSAVPPSSGTVATPASSSPSSPISAPRSQARP